MTEPFGTVAFAAGVGVAAFFSPCAYALLPGYVGYYVSATDGDDPPLAGAVVRGGAAVVGAVITFAALAAVPAVVGNTLRSVLPALEVSVGVALVLLGAVVLLDVDFGAHVPLPKRRATVTGFGLFGALYAVAAAGCVAPLFLAVVVQSLALSPVETVGVFAGLTVPFAALLLAVTVVLAAGYDAGVRWVSGFSSSMVRVAGALIVAAGGGQLWLVLA